MNVTYESRRFDPANIVATYARRYSNGEVKFFDIDAKSKTIREYWLPDHECDPAIVGRCKDAGYEMARVS